MCSISIKLYFCINVSTILQRKCKTMIIVHIFSTKCATAKMREYNNKVLTEKLLYSGDN